MFRSVVLLTLSLLLIAGSANAKLELADRCESDKIRQAGRYHSCRMKAERNAIRRFTDPSEAIAKCDVQYDRRWERIEDKGGEECPTNGDQASMQSRLTDQVADLTTLLSGGSLPDPNGCASQTFPATGQLTCWDTFGNDIACAGTGQDGEVLAGAPLAYLDNLDGTITDLNTGLMWEKLSYDGSIHDFDTRYSWDDAFVVKVATLNSTAFAGHTDWRVPNIKELFSIVNIEFEIPTVSPAFNNGCILGCTVTTCSCTEGESYWSSSSAPTSTGQAWFVGFFDGNVERRSKQTTTPLSVRAVRGP